jgi:hypothetical protein
VTGLGQNIVCSDRSTRHHICVESACMGDPHDEMVGNALPRRSASNRRWCPSCAVRRGADRTQRGDRVCRLHPLGPVPPRLDRWPGGAADREPRRRASVLVEGFGVGPSTERLGLTLGRERSGQCAAPLCVFVPAVGLASGGGVATSDGLAARFRQWTAPHGPSWADPGVRPHTRARAFGKDSRTGRRARVGGRVGSTRGDRLR